MSKIFFLMLSFFHESNTTARSEMILRLECKSKNVFSNDGPFWSANRSKAALGKAAGPLGVDICFTAP